MKKFAIIAAMAAALTLQSCKIEHEETFDPTSLGYNLALDTSVSLFNMLEQVNFLRNFNRYLAAPTDEERDAVHDQYFYDWRIAERNAGEWHIIRPNIEYTVLTEGKLLGQSDAKWIFYDNHGKYPEDELPSLCSVAGDNECYDVHNVIYSSTLGRSFTSDFRLEYSSYSILENGEPREVECTKIDGGGDINGYYYTTGHRNFEVQILKPLLFNPLRSYIPFSEGHMVMTIDINGQVLAPEALFERGAVTIRGGRDNAYSKSYDYFMPSGYYHYE